MSGSHVEEPLLHNGEVATSPRWSRTSQLAALLVSLTCVLAYASFTKPPNAPQKNFGGHGRFAIEDNRFMQDGRPVQIISGSVHYQRVHPEYWRDRLLRVRSMGLNAIQTYVPWNVHEQTRGNCTWDGFADLERFVRLAAELDFLVLLRPGPYICAEHDFGGFPWWLANSKTPGARDMKLRSSDPNFLRAVDAWWGELLPRMRPLLYQNGGPIIMVQVENEYGFCGSDKAYLRHLIATARKHLGTEVIMYTTDPPAIVPKGSIYGDEVYTVVDFGPGWFQPQAAFLAQRAMNPSGKSPPFCSEYYTGWLTHWGEAMANTSAAQIISTLKGILSYAGGTGSVNLYMAHGGTNFGYWAGANVGPAQYWPHITSYDYDCPISEAGSTGQPGIGGDNKFEAIRDAIRQHTGKEPPLPLPPPHIAAYGEVPLTQSAALLASLDALAAHRAHDVESPDIMEEYGQSGGLIVYRTQLANDSAPWLSESTGNALNTLTLGARPHDYAQVFIDGELVGRLDRDHQPVLRFTSPAAVGSDGSRSRGGERRRVGGGGSTLDIVVQAMGRFNFGCVWDTKGLQSADVRLNGKSLFGWRVFPLQLEDLSVLDFGRAPASGSRNASAYSSGGGSEEAAVHLAAAASNSQAAAQSQQEAAARSAAAVVRGTLTSEPLRRGPVFYRGTFTAKKSVLSRSRHLHDTFLSTAGFGKGIAFINGFNLGWYWPTRGPQQTLYIPGPLLRQGQNELVLLEVDTTPSEPAVKLVSQPDFRSWRPLPLQSADHQEAEDSVLSGDATIGQPHNWSRRRAAALRI